MSITSLWLGDVITRFQLRSDTRNNSRINRHWSMIDRASLLERVCDVCQEINSGAREGVVYGRMFARPYPMAFRVGFVRGDTEFLMSLAMLDEIPTLVFSWRREYQWKKSLLPWLRHSAARKEYPVFEREIDPSSVSDAEIQRWFTYLLSGLRRRFKPVETKSMQRIFGPIRAYSSEGSV